MSLDLIDMSNDFEDWLHEIGVRPAEYDLSEERLVQLVSATLREVGPEARAQGFVDLANLCYAMADKTLGSLGPSAKCLAVAVSVNQRH
jgi:hypothetical protein